ncbi:MAG: SDR family oxidoreductase, partial [Candidatus Riflebacteria bacterium]|nr:SDR family oxidoreductase [Candidatus Riflebacteria bacterium]
KGCAELLLENNAIVIGLDICEPEILNAKYEHKIVDIRNEEEIECAINEIENHYSQIFGLVNCAGINSIKKPFFEISLDEWNNLISINLTGTFLVAKYVCKNMILNKTGKIVNISCIRSRIFKKNMAEYSASKGGVVALTSSMAIDLAPYNIQVNSVAPGLTSTKMTEKIIKNNSLVEEEFNNMIPQKRMAKPKDIANVVLFLLSDSSKYITGETIFADGGFSISK